MRRVRQSGVTCRGYIILAVHITERFDAVIFYRIVVPIMQQERIIESVKKKRVKAIL